MTSVRNRTSFAPIRRSALRSAVVWRPRGFGRLINSFSFALDARAEYEDEQQLVPTG